MHEGARSAVTIAVLCTLLLIGATLAPRSSSIPILGQGRWI